MAISLSADNALRGCIPFEDAYREIRDLLNIVQALSSVEAGFIDGVTAGTAAASKALVLDASKGISTITSATITTLTSTTVNTTTLAASGAITSSSPTTGIGYATGAGGTVTQATSKTTGVTLSKVCGQITLNNAALAAGAEATFTVTNTAVAATDVVHACHGSAGTSGAYLVGVSNITAGTFDITVSNVSAGSLSEAIVINFAVLKGVAA